MRTFLAAAVSTVLLAACSSGGNDSPPPTTGSFRVVNATSVPFDEIYIAPTEATSWGAVQNAAPVPAGSSFTLGGVAPGLTDVEIVSYETIGNVGAGFPYYAWGTDWMVTAGETTIVTFDDVHFTSSLQVYNGDVYSADLTALYVVPSDSSGGWGMDQLGDVIVPVTESYTVWAIPPGYYDVLCEFDYGSVSDVVTDVLLLPLSTEFLACDGGSGASKAAPTPDAAKGTLGSSAVGGRYAPPAAAEVAR